MTDNEPLLLRIIITILRSSSLFFEGMISILSRFNHKVVLKPIKEQSLTSYKHVKS